MTGRGDQAHRPTASTTGPTRPPLPDDPATCPALDAGFAASLDRALAALGLALSPGQHAGIEAHVRLLLAWNAAINLTAIREAAAIALEHVADALTAVEVILAMGQRARPALLDLGSGAGYPGLPLGLVVPAGRLVLVDSIGKKARFLQVAASAAMAAMAAHHEAPPAIEAVAARAETLAHDRAHRGRYDLVTARAVGSLGELVELGLPLLRPGGHLVAWKRQAQPEAFGRGDDGAPPTLARELADADGILTRIGGDLVRVEPVAVPGLEDHRLVVVRAGRAAPTLYPRPPAERRRIRG